MTTKQARSVRGEQLEVSERVILAPAVGVFRPAALDSDGPDADHQLDAGTMVAQGDVVGVVEARGQALPVQSSFTGFLMGMLAHPGERVREGQPVAWMRTV